MNLPQFTAEFALYRSKNVYRENGAAAEMTDWDPQILPAGPSQHPGGGFGGGPQVHCVAPYSQCGNVCKDLSTDAANCHECGNVCADDMCCIGGRCTTVDTNYDSNNCGDCNSKCPLIAPFCCSGECLTIEMAEKCQNCGTNCPTGYYCGGDGYTCIACPAGPDPIQSPGSNVNYIMYNSCSPIDQLSYSMYVNKDLVSGSGGFSLQFNNYTKATGYENTVIQLIFHVSDQILAHIQYPGGTPDGIDHDWQKSFSKITLENDTLPAHYTLGVALSNDGNGNINGAAFTVEDNNGKSYTISAPASAFPSGKYLYPISEFQANLVGYGGGATASFSPGGKATITYSSEGQLCVEGANPNCTGSDLITDEKANTGYGELSSCCGGSLTQPVFITS